MVVRVDQLTAAGGVLTIRCASTRGTIPPDKAVALRFEDLQSLKEAAARVLARLNPDDLILLKAAEVIAAQPSITLAQAKTALEGKTFSLAFTEV